MTTTGFVNSLSQADQQLIGETMRDELLQLDEDALLDLHARVRRARNKYNGLYRRQASARVVELGGRGLARPKNTRNAQTAEVFEDALSRVSRQLAVVARRTAQELKAERIADARSQRTTPKAVAPPKKKAPVKPMTSQRNKAPRTTAMAKRVSTSQASGARRQARKDNR
jgi:hypothetical protein